MSATTETKVYYEPGKRITCTAAAAITAGTFVKISATRADGENIKVTTCTAGAAAFGVALYSAASGDLVSVAPIAAGGIVGVTVGTGGVTAGQEVESDAAGKAVTLASGKSCGMTVTTAAAAATAQIAIGR